MEYRLFVLIGESRGESFDLLPNREYILGRHSENDIKILDKHISRNHFKINIRNRKYYITDLHSKNGTFVNGRDLIHGIETEVKEGIPILIGTTILGLGEESELYLKPFLDSAGFGLESDESGEVMDRDGIINVKKNLLFIHNISNSLIAAKDLEEIVEKLLNNIYDLLKRIDRCVIIIVDYETGKVGDIAYRSKKPVEDLKKIYNPEIVEHALLIKKPVIVKDSKNIEDEDDKVTESLQLMKIRSAMCVPIIGCYGSRGAIYVDSLEMPNGFRVNDALLLKDVSGRAAQAMDRVFLEETCHLE